MNTLLLILHLIPISTPPSIDRNSALLFITTSMVISELLLMQIVYKSLGDKYKPCPLGDKEITLWAENKMFPQNFFSDLLSRALESVQTLFTKFWCIHSRPKYTHMFAN